MPRGSAAIVQRVPDPLRKGHQGAKYAGVKSRREHVQKGNAVAQPAVTAVYECPPEEQGGSEKANMLQCMDGFAFESCLVKSGDVPDPNSGPVQ